MFRSTVELARCHCTLDALECSRISVLPKQTLIANYIPIDVSPRSPGVGADRWTLTFVGHYDYQNRSHYDGAGEESRTSRKLSSRNVTKHPNSPTHLWSSDVKCHQALRTGLHSSVSWRASFTRGNGHILEKRAGNIFDVMHSDEVIVVILVGGFKHILFPIDSYFSRW